MNTLYESYSFDLRKNIDIIVESFIRGTCHTWVDRDNDRLVVSIIDTHHKMWCYEETNYTSRLFAGLSATTIAHKVIMTYREKIFSEYFK